MIANLTNIEHQPVVGDLIYGSDTYYAQITRVGESVVEFTVIGQIADLQAVYDFIQDAFDDITANIAFKNQSNVFTQPQQVPNATLAQHAVNKLQVETMFEMFKRQLRGYNLAMPDLTGKTDLGGGNYRLSNANGVTIDYNVNSGVWTINGISTGIVGPIIINIDTNTQYTLSYIAVSGTLSGGTLDFYTNPPYSIILSQVSQNINKQETFTTTLTQNQFRFDAGSGRTFTNYQFKLQLSKGSTSTPHTVPGQIPQYKIVGEA